MMSRRVGNSQKRRAVVLLVTATKDEVQAVIEAFSPKRPRVFKKGDKFFQDFGVISHSRIMLVQTEMGAEGVGSSQQSVQQAIAAVSPSAVICLGVAFGVDPHRQRIGDVLVSRQIALYEPQKVGKQNVHTSRGDRPHASAQLIDWLRTAASVSGTNGVRVDFGLLVSGEKLVDNLAFRDELLEFAPEAIGGEMEGAGVYAACHAQKVDWILVKAICDWADGNKAQGESLRREDAAGKAARFVLSALKRVPLAAESRAQDIGGEHTEALEQTDPISAEMGRRALAISKRPHGRASSPLFRIIVGGSFAAALLCFGLYQSFRLTWIQLERDFVHLGDARSSIFRPIEPSGIAKSYKFSMDRVPTKVEVRLIAKDVDPDPDNGPFLLVVNGVRAKFINEYFSDVKRNEEHTAPWREVVIRDLSLGIFKPGENELTLIVPSVRNLGSDDVNYYDFFLGYR
jgi:nucleoside phosphorylase